MDAFLRQDEAWHYVNLIEEAMLVAVDGTGTSITDSWHPTIAAAKAQAAFEYGVEDSDWG